MENRIVIIEWKSNRFVALKTRLMHPEIVWQKKEGKDKKRQWRKQIEGCTVRFLKEFAGTDYCRSTRDNNCSWLLAWIACIAEKLKCVRSYYLIDLSERLTKRSLCAGSGLFSSHLLNGCLTKTGDRYIREEAGCRYDIAYVHVSVKRRKRKTDSH